MTTWVRGSPSDAEITDRLVSTAWTPASRLFKAGFVLSGMGTIVLLGLVGWSVVTGTGLWGNDIPTAWGFPIINFVWWIGIGHAGTFISAILLLLEQRWRTSINRFAEAMTLFAVLQAALFPILHLGRPWFFYWLVPYPSTMEVWPQFLSALPWDAAAIFTYGTVSLLFWYLGLVPDLAAMRDGAPTRRQRRIYAVFSLGWSGQGMHWRRYKIAYGLLAGLATPLVISVHSIVASDFAMTMLPGWHSTLFPPFFVAGAILSGFAMVLLVMIPVRRFFGLQAYITRDHLDAMAKTLLVTAWIVIYSYVIEAFIAWYSGLATERHSVIVARMFTGPHAWVYWLTIACNALAPQVLWTRAGRRSSWILWTVSLLVLVGMWCERFVLVSMSLQEGFLPAAWGTYWPTLVDWGILLGTIAFFMFLFLLFLRFVPFVPVAEVKELVHEEREKGRPHETA